MDLKKVVRSFPDFPKKGILFRDITPLLKDPLVLDYVIKQIAEQSVIAGVDLVAGIESRGFLFGSCLAFKLGKGFIIVRKAGKLPGETVKTSYTIEYGTASIELQADAITKGQKVLIVDDLLATGGTAAAAAELVEQLGGIVSGLAFVIELAGLNGRAKLDNYSVHSLVKYD